MFKRLSFNDLVEAEKKYHLWDYKLFEYPLWIHCREPIFETAMMAERKFKIPSVYAMLKSMFQTIGFLLVQNRYNSVYFLMERAEVLEIYHQDKSKKKILFLNKEQDIIYQKNDYISSDFFNLLRFVSRKVSYLIFYSKYKELSSKMLSLDFGSEINGYIKQALGDALFLKFLSLVLSKKNKKIYTGCVIPIGEKFINALNSYEVQHGVIHDTHVGYVEIPSVKNNLILYSEKYKTIMKDFKYQGTLIVNEFKQLFLGRKTGRYFPVVIYTQPSYQMQQAIEEFLLEYQPMDVFIQKHPKDYFSYSLEKSRFVSKTIPSEVGFPIFHTTTVIENFTDINKKCYIYDMKKNEPELKKFLKIYTADIEKLCIIKETIGELYDIIKETIKAKKC